MTLKDGELTQPLHSPMSRITHPYKPLEPHFREREREMLRIYVRFLSELSGSRCGSSKPDEKIPDFFLV